MRLVTYRARSGPRAGVLRDGEVADAWQALGSEPADPSVKALVAGRRLPDLEAVQKRLRFDRTGERLTPVPDPDKIICIGLNYRAHAEEAGIEAPDSPTFFAKFRNALVPDGATVTLPAASDKVDFEAEVAFVIGRRAKQVAESDALDHVAGYTLLNDLSARDLQFATPQWLPGKVFDGSAPCGPALVTPDEAGAHDAIEFKLTLNGETMQAASTDDLIFSVPALVSQLSRLMTLEPGDIVSTGTPSGVGSTRDPRLWLKHGDRLSITSPTLGTLATTIARSDQR